MAPENTYFLLTIACSRKFGTTLDVQMLLISKQIYNFTVPNTHYMSQVILQIRDAIVSTLRSFFSSDLDVMSDEVKQILANPQDAAKYMEAVEQMKDGKQKEVTIELSNHRTLTLIQ